MAWPGMTVPHRFFPAPLNECPIPSETHSTHSAMISAGWQPLALRTEWHLNVPVWMGSAPRTAALNHVALS
jgi:hypothetical protein